MPNPRRLLQFDESGIVWVQADKIYGYGRTMDTNGTVLFYGGHRRYSNPLPVMIA